MPESRFRPDFTTVLVVGLAIVLGLVVTMEIWMPHSLADLQPNLTTSLGQRPTSSKASPMTPCISEQATLYDLTLGVVHLLTACLSASPETVRY